jgi:hypothetical protein
MNFFFSWSYLQVQTNPQSSDMSQAFGAGYVESLLTYDLMYKHWYNTLHGFCETRQGLCRRVQDHLDKNLVWVNDMIANHSNTEPYWHQVRLLLVIFILVMWTCNKILVDPVNAKNIKLTYFLYLAE